MLHYSSTYSLKVIALSALLISGCVTGAKKSPQQQLPEWFHNPHYDGYVGVTSSAPVQKIGGIQGQRRVALLKARSEMARMQNVQIQSHSKTFREVSSAGVKFNYDDYRKISSAQALDLYNVVVKDEWVNPETGELFLWLTYPVK